MAPNLSTARFCVLCNCVKLSAFSHRARCGQLHELRKATAAELEAFEARKTETSTSSGNTEAEGTLEPEAKVCRYVFEFGKHKGKSLEWVRGNKHGYVEWLVKSKVHLQYPALCKAVRHLGLLGEKEEEASLSVALFEHAKADGVEAKVGQKRKHASRAVVRFKNCSLRGASDHNASSCPQRGALSELAQKMQVALAYRQAGRKAKASGSTAKQAQFMRQWASIPKARERQSRLPLILGTEGAERPALFVELEAAVLAAKEAADKATLAQAASLRVKAAHEEKSSSEESTQRP
ncbi:unnamed protein product [Polarella glacialis]|uniref:Uncharacterized protein n=1 Tax=Polarella glacialis TaxID=89957 RepID=A0A813EJP2_POLGL|nr:unnamed protein product [Polarella glacialis]